MNLRGVDLIYAKINILCFGIRPTDIALDLFQVQNPFNHKRTGNAGLQLLLGDELLAANIPIGDNFTHTSPFTIECINDNYSIYKNRDFYCSCMPVQTPD